MREDEGCTYGPHAQGSREHQGSQGKEEGQRLQHQRQGQPEKSEQPHPVQLAVRHPGQQ